MLNVKEQGLYGAIVGICLLNTLLAIERYISVDDRNNASLPNITLYYNEHTPTISSYVGQLLISQFLRQGSMLIGLICM